MLARTPVLVMTTNTKSNSSAVFLSIKNIDLKPMLIKSVTVILIATFLSACSGGSGQSESSEEAVEVKKLPYFFVSEMDGEDHLWMSNGTEDGTRRVKDIYPSGDPKVSYLLVAGEVLYFYARDGVHGRELWRSDGTEDGTFMVKDINTQVVGATGSTDDGPTFEDMVSIDNVVYFEANDGVHGEELWRSDGTADGTYMLNDIVSGIDSARISNLSVAGKKLFFRVSDGGATEGFWVSDGTEAGTVQLKAGLYFASYAIEFGGSLYFQANDQIDGDELWRSDGTVAGTTRVKNIRLGSGSSSPKHFAKTNNAFFFQASDDDHAHELWKSDGTENGTVLVKDIHQSHGSRPDQLTVIGNTVYFRADDGVHGAELWKSDGTEVGTVLVKDINIHPGGPGDPGRLYDLAAINDTLYFSAHDGVSGFELWRSDGTEGGTQRVTDINIGISDSLPYLRSYNHVGNSSGDPYVLADGRFLINARETNHGRELYVTDGKVAGVTTLVKDINVGTGDGFYNDEE